MIKTIKASKSEKILFIFLSILAVSAFTSFFLLKNKCLFIDKNDLKKLRKTFIQFNPDYVFHLAAQAIVQVSYSQPIKTWRTNLIGTVNILECLRMAKKKTIAIMITSDKAYQNLEIKRGYNENDILKGTDPYGASKSSADIAINSYYHSFFSKKKIHDLKFL